MRFAVAILLWASASFANGRNSIIERLAEAAWLPLHVRAEWQTAGNLPTDFIQQDDWQLAEPRPMRLAGSLVLNLERKTSSGAVERTAVSGTLRIFGPSLTVKHALNKGAAMLPSDIETVQADWTYLAGDVLQETDLKAETVTAHSLVPGRVLTKRDIKTAPRIHRGQAVQIVYEEGSVRVRLAGRALKDGAVGERVQVAVDLKTSRKFEGCVAADGTVQLIR